MLCKAHPLVLRCATQNSCSPLLPFLYHTRTILQRNASSYAQNNRGSRGGAKSRLRNYKSRFDGAAELEKLSKDSTFGQIRNTERSGEKSPRWQRPQRGSAPGAKPYPTSAALSNPPARKFHVPFEVGAELLDPLHGVAGPTTTRAERQAFRAIMGKVPDKSAAKQKKGSKQKLEAGTAMNNRSEMSANDGRKESTERTAQPKEHTGGRQSEQADKVDMGDAAGNRSDDAIVRPFIPATAEELYSMDRKAIDDAQTDHELWDVMHQRILQPVQAMELASSRVDQRNTPEPVARERELRLMAQNLPKYLIDLILAFRTRFPTSILSLLVLPSLKKLGPEAFALGATTELYNLHMQELYRKYTDLDGVLDTLTEMDEAVYIPDHKTLAVIDEICDHHGQALDGVRGPAQKVLWSTDRRTRAVRKLHEWRHRVQERRNEEALRQVRDQEPETSMSEMA